MAAGDDQDHRGEEIVSTRGRAGDVVKANARAQPVAVDVPLEVVHPNQRQAGGESQPLGSIDADEQAARQPWPLCDGDGVQRPRRSDPRLGQRLAQHGVNRKHMLPAGHLGEDTPKAAVDIDLGGHHIAQQPPSILNHGGGGFVTTGFNGENLHN